MSLYPTMLHGAELKALRGVLDKREQYTIPTSELIRMVDFVLKNNYFKFNGQIKQQISGTTIGTKFVPPYTCLFMDKIETAFFEIQQLQPLVWVRYIDNVYFIWTHVTKNFKLFCVALMSSILTWNLLMSQAKKALHLLTLKLVLKAVTLLQICI